LSKDVSNIRNIKDLSINLLEIAECNLLLSIKDLKPEEIFKQLLPDINPINWIFGHCMSHLDYVFNELCQGKKMITEEIHNHYAFGVSKEIAKSTPPISFKKLVDLYLQISKNTFDYLKKLPEEKFRAAPEASIKSEIKETLMEFIQRVSLHFMGHMGQIVLIRRNIGNPGSSFVAGIEKNSRIRHLENWQKWWLENKEKFK